VKIKTTTNEIYNMQLELDKLYGMKNPEFKNRDCRKKFYYGAMRTLKQIKRAVDNTLAECKEGMADETEGYKKYKSELEVINEKQKSEDDDNKAHKETMKQLEDTYKDEIAQRKSEMDIVNDAINVECAKEKEFEIYGIELEYLPENIDKLFFSSLDSLIRSDS